LLPCDHPFSLPQTITLPHFSVAPSVFLSFFVSKKKKSIGGFLGGVGVVKKNGGFVLIFLLCATPRFAPLPPQGSVF
jgi:hypothetical protein